MQIDFLDEPELDFGSGRHIDIRFGIANYGPHDIDSEHAPRVVRLGVVGTGADIERARGFIEKCRSEIPGPATRQPNLRPAFPGFNQDQGFYSTVAIDDELCREIPPKIFEKLALSENANHIVREAVESFLNEFTYLARNRSPNVLLCAVPEQLARLLDPAQRPPIPRGEPLLNFRDMLKARALHLPPIQLILPSTSDPSRARKSKGKRETRQIQDEATRAWNLHTAFYYKAKGRPWRLPRDLGDFATCYVGVSFYHTLDRTSVLTSVAQVFDERGEGLVVQGGPAKVSNSDRTIHLEQGDSRELLTRALREYRATHGNAPARVVVHKTSDFSQQEREGFREAVGEERVDRIDMVSIAADPSQRLYRYGAYPPLRGTLLHLDDTEHMLYTRGSVEFYATYPGLYVPQPLLFRCDDVEQGPKQLARELLGLSKLNWNRTQFDGSDPITVVAARSVGQILKYCQGNLETAARYSHFM
jgi:hypothetical protein